MVSEEQREVRIPLCPILRVSTQPIYQLGRWARRIGSLKNNILSKENNISSGLFPIVLRYIYSSRVPLN